MEKSIVRKQGIAARDSLTAEEKIRFSQIIADKIIESEEFKKARTIMLYKAVEGELDLSVLEAAVEKVDSAAFDYSKNSTRRLVYPHCINEAEMIALEPHGIDSWAKGRFGIMEPQPDKSAQVSPEEIDLIICPCTAFDEAGNRMGMGAGYYDRFLPKCKNAAVIAVAFECQKADLLHADPHDIRMEAIYTEETVYRPDRAF